MWAEMFTWGGLQVCKSDVIMTELQIPQITTYSIITKKVKAIYWQGQLWEYLYIMVYLITGIYSRMINLTTLKN
jgi:hypothetical protein